MATPVRRQKRRARVSRIAAGMAVCALLTALVSVAPAFAAPGAWWYVGSMSFPSQLQPGGEGYLLVSTVNRGYEAANGGGGSPITLTDVLPTNVEVTEIHARAVSSWNKTVPTPAPTPECQFTSHRVSCEYTGKLEPYARLWILSKVKVAAGAHAQETSEVSTGGAGLASRASSVVLGLAGGETPFGLESAEVAPEEVGGGVATQAGGHPFQLTTTIDLNKTARVPQYNPNEAISTQPALPKDVNVNLPPGLVGNPTVFPQCTASQFSELDLSSSNGCPQDTAVGVANIIIDDLSAFDIYSDTVPVFNLVPERGEPARFGFTVLGSPVYLDTSVRTGGDYGVTVHVSNISQVAALLGSEVTFWGTPGDSRHNGSRGWECGITELHKFLESSKGVNPCVQQNKEVQQPFLVMPTSCTGPLQASVEMDSWKEPHNVLSYGLTVPMPGMDGCNRLNFEPAMSVTPDSQEGSTASGLAVDLHVPQNESLLPTGLSEANVKNTTVALPEGLVLNPSAADGLQACSTEEVGLGSAAASFCPEAAKVGTVTIHTPLLPDPLTGAAYLAQQDANPFGSLVALYIVAEDPKAGVLVKLAGEVHLTESGQIISTFKETPQLPFEDFELHFFGGDRAPLATPAACGSYTTMASLDPWSGTPAVAPSSTFLVTSGPGGSSCNSQLGFSPSLTGGSENIQAGEFSPFTTTMSRSDGEQAIGSVTMKFPAGLLGTLSGVELCGEAQANAGTCGSGSLIGHTIVSVGIGGDPFSVTGGRVYMTGAYRGAPFGLSIVNPAVAGPFNLGTVVVRAKVEVDPHTAQLTVTTDPSGGYAIPQILDGIPLQIRHVNVTVDRKGFTFNPTSCQKMAITGAIGSSSGATSALAVPFQVANCANLAFKPKFAVSTSAHTSRQRGASLDVKLSYPGGSMGAQANIHSVKVDLPRALPSRLTTLQRACTAKQFDTDPAGCPAESVVGHAIVHTQVLPVPLEGPAYFVSHGGEAFPNLILVLQGYGVTVDLVGDTNIKNGITSSTFTATPDVPFESFELNLPQGPYSALAANGNLCTSKLLMPTSFTAQNGMVIQQSTPVAVAGCAKTKALTRAQKLKQALKACHKDKSKTKRKACEAVARKKYGPQSKGKTSKRRK